MLSPVATHRNVPLDGQPRVGLDHFEVKIVPEVLYFGPYNWSTPQIVEVAAVDDNIDRGLCFVTVFHRVTSNRDAKSDGIEQRFHGIVVTGE